MAVELLRVCLDIRDGLNRLASMTAEYGYDESLPELKQMQDLERTVFEKLNELDKP